MIYKSNDIEVILDEPMFSGNSVWYPGYVETKSFQIKNLGDETKQAQIEALAESETNNLSQGLILEIRNDAGCVYGCSEVKTLRNFWDAGSVNIGEVPAGGNGKVFTIKAAMPIAAEDRYQGGRASFDLRIGFKDEEESTVVVQVTESSTSSISNTGSTLLRQSASEGQASNTDIGEVAGENTDEITTAPIITQGTVMGETVKENGGANNWWFSWWWLVLLLILTALAWWWNRRRKD